MVLVKRQPKVIRFVDRTFNTLYERTLELWQFLADLPGNTLFHFEIAPDRFSPEMLQFLQDIPAGRFQFEIGLQSTTAATLQSINRWIDTERALNNIKTLIGFDNIHIHVDLILGLPFETVSSFKNSFEDVFRLMPHYIQMGLLKVLPGTRIRHTNGYDLIYCQSPPYELLANKWLDHNSLQHCYWLGECIEAFYNNRFFRSVFDYLQKGKASAWEFFEELFTVCKEHDFFTLAKTQEFMSRLLFELFNRRGEGDIGRELLRYEWLRSGHKFLPDHLGQPDFKGTRDRLYFSLPQNFPPFYTYPTREVFFKKGVFLNFSGEVLQILGFEADDTGGTLCFLQEQTTGVHRHQKSVLIAKGRKIMELEKGD